MERFWGRIKNLTSVEGAAEVTLVLPPAAGKMVWKRKTEQVEVGVEDGRYISPQQRKKIYATLRDIGEHTGYTIEAAKEIMKVENMIRTGDTEYFSLSNCSMTKAREYLNTLMEYALQEGVILKDSGLDRTDDIDTYLIQCIRYRRCCICGRDADIHHVDAIGMGNNRRFYDDSRSLIMALCRQHHTICHQRGNDAFMKAYKVYGVQKCRIEGVGHEYCIDE